MSNAPWIPMATRRRLAHPAPPGQRHAEIVKVATSLLTAGLNAEAAFQRIRPAYGSDVPDAEIRAVIRWANRIPQPVSHSSTRFHPRNHPFGSRGFRTGVPEADFRFMGGHGTRFRTGTRKPETGTAETTVLRFLGGFSYTEADLWEASPYRLLGPVESDAVSLLSVLYDPAESINIVAEYAKSGGKARPIGYGTTLKRDEWLAHFRENGPPKSAAGVWIRPNPTDGKGISDINVAHFRFALLEFDSIPLSLQLAFFARLPLPIAAVITSGGKSLHAWVRIDAETADDYRKMVSHLFRILQPFGIDPANRNPARLSRLPGISRELGGEGDKRQRLLYLNPFPNTAPIFP